LTEIRLCGAQNMQIARRSRAMIENLIESLPKHHHATLLEQLTLLDREVDSSVGGLFFNLPQPSGMGRQPLLRSFANPFGASRHLFSSVALRTPG
jgi:hypothetical protein